MQRFLQACMQLIQTQEYISWKLPKGWTIALTTNPSTEDYIVNESDLAQKTRYINVGLKWDANSYAKWAEFNGVDGRFINFVLLNSDLLEGDNKHKEVNPRTITMFADLISNIDDFNSVESLTKIQTLGEATVGINFTSMFTMFINNRLDKLPSPKYIMTEDNLGEVKKTLEEVINKDGNCRADISSVLGRRIINYSLNYANKNPIKDDYISRLGSLLIDSKIFTVDIGFNAVKQIYSGNKVKFKNMVMKPWFSEIIKA